MRGAREEEKEEEEDGTGCIQNEYPHTEAWWEKFIMRRSVFVRRCVYVNR